MPEATEAQRKFAAKIAQTLGEEIPDEALNDLREMSAWIDAKLALVDKDEYGKAVFKPSAKATAYAERIAGALGVQLTSEYYLSEQKLSRFIDEHKEKYQEQLKGPSTL